MNNTTGRAIVKACCALAIGAATWAPTGASAALQQTTAPTVGGGTAKGVLDTETGLQWLTPQATIRLSYADVVSAGYLSLGYRFATSGELIDLIGHSGFATAVLVANLPFPYASGDAADSTAMRTLIDLIGPTQVAPPAGGAFPYGIKYVNGMLADVSEPGGQWHYLATFGASDMSASAHIPGAPFATSDDSAGSFLVRSVPEPGTLGMLAAGLLVVAAGVRRSRSPSR